MTRLCPAILTLSMLALSFSPLAADEARGQPGHSLHGEAFDDGPRQEAWRMQGMGDVHFPVTAATAEAQAFFDQGVAQLHTFYYFEAERSFRQTALLDPRCAMAYWGMAMANVNNHKRAQSFLEKSKPLQAAASDREKKYLEALGALFKEGRNDSERREDYLKGLEAVVLAYPDDIEAKAFLAWALVGSGRVQSRVAVDVLTREVLKRSPHHPGAHHYRIHLWDGNDPAQALDSALAYAGAAPGIAHAWHMPGHIYNGLSRFKEAAYQQEGSARVDHAHQLAHLILPFQIHNYAHNSHYLIANLSHLGRVRDAVDFGRSLVETPRDPQKNDKGNGGSAQRLGRFSLMRIYVRYERWDDLLSDPHLDWSDLPEEQAWKAYSRGLALLEKGDRAGAVEEIDRLEGMAARAAKSPGHEADLLETMRLEARGRERVREGKLLEGFELLEKGAKLQLERFREDLSGYPRPFREALGLAHLEAQDWGLADANFREVLEQRHETLVSLFGLVEACFRGGKKKEAAAAYERFLAGWHEADQDLPYLKRLEPVVASLAKEGFWKPGAEVAGAGVAGAGGSGAAAALPPESPRVALETLGPKLWTPSPAPDFTLRDSKGKEWRLSGLKGKNLVLVFSLGGSCPHCLEQLLLLGKEKGALEGLQAQVLSVLDEPASKVEELLGGPQGASLTFPLLLDPGHKAAKLYGVHDGFEDLPLHGLFLIDRDGRVRWFRIGSEPFLDLAFVKSELERVDRLLKKEL